MEKYRNLIILLIFICSGCVPVENGVGNLAPDELTETFSGEDSSTPFSTATPPAFPDLRGTTFDVYLLGADSDVFRDITESISLGLEDGFAFLNAQGGINGAQIAYHFVGVSDYGEGLEAAYADLLDQDPFLILLAAPLTEDFYALVNKSEVPVLFYGFGTNRLQANEEGDDYLFWLTSLPDQQMAFSLREIWANWDEVRPPGNFNEMKVGYLTWQEDFNYLALTAESRVYIQRNSFSLDLEEEIPISVNTSATNFLLDAVYSGVTVLFTDTVSFGPAVLLNDITTLGLSDFFVVAGTQWILESNMNRYFRGHLVSDRIYFPLSTAWWTEEDNPAIERAILISTSSGRDSGDLGEGYLISLGAVDIVSTVLTRIIDENESGNIHADDVMDYLSVLNYDVMGGLFSVDYRNGNRTVEGIRLWQYSHDGSMTPVGELSEVPTMPLIEE